MIGFFYCEIILKRHQSGLLYTTNNTKKKQKKTRSNTVSRSTKKSLFPKI